MAGWEITKWGIFQRAMLDFLVGNPTWKNKPLGSLENDL